jgi:hypothetical protein
MRFVVCFLLLSIVVHSQDASTGAIRGTILDPSGGRIAGASIALINNSTGSHYSAISDDLGQFSFQLLPP